MPARKLTEASNTGPWKKCNKKDDGIKCMDRVVYTIGNEFSRQCKLCAGQAIKTEKLMH